ncbi:Chloroperoxidase [Sporodiniella umbellata]|nr:Chloroperoxidase [Sporodiniella umbellata]
MGKSVPKIRSVLKKSRISSLILGLLVTVTVFVFLALETKSRSKRISSPEKWSEIMKDHPYQFHDSFARSPCPMLNTLANHGFISRDGRNIKPEELYDVLSLLRFTPSLSAGFLVYLYSVYHEAVPDKSFWASLGPKDSIDLNQLRVYGVFEHDVSLTRQDSALFPHNTTVPNIKCIMRMVRLAETNKNTPDEGYFTWENESTARRLRWLESIKNNQAYHYPFFTQFTSSFECRILLDVIGRDGRLRIDHLVSFLLHEKIPDDWYPPIKSFNGFSVISNTVKCWSRLRSNTASLDLLNELE